MPVVAHRWGGYSEYIRDGMDAFLFDTQEEALDILESLRKDVDLRMRMAAQAGIARVERYYTHPVMFSRYRAVYDQALGVTPPPPMAPPPDDSGLDLLLEG